MSSQKLRGDSYCVCGRHRSATTRIYGDITSKLSKVVIGCCSVCNRKKSMTVSSNTLQAEGPSGFFKKLGRISAKAVKKPATKAIKNPGRFLDIGAKLGTAAASRNPKAALSTLPEVIKVYHTSKGLNLGKFVYLCYVNGPKM